MTINAFCPTCSAKIKAPDTAHGRRVKCPSCNSPFVVSATGSETPVASSRPEFPKPLLEVITCPYCHASVGNDPRYAGMAVGCPICQGQFVMPGASDSSLRLPSGDSSQFPSVMPSSALQPYQSEATVGQPCLPNLKRYFSLPWLIMIFILGFLPWSQVSCNSNEKAWRFTQSGYQTLYGGIDSPFNTLEAAKKAMQNEPPANRQELEKLIDVERDNFLLTYSPFMVLFWAAAVGVFLCVCFVPYCNQRFAVCLTLAIFMLLMLIALIVFGTPLERKVEFAVQNKIKDSPDSVITLIASFTLGKTLSFWVTIGILGIATISEFITHYLWRNPKDSAPVAKVAIIGALTAFIMVGGISAQMINWQSKIDEMETRLAYLKKIQQDEAAEKSRIEFEKRSAEERRERKKQEEILKRQEYEERKRNLEREKAEHERLETERQQAEMARLKRIKEEELAAKKREEDKERDRLEHLSEKDIKEIISLLKGTPHDVEIGLKSVMRIGPKATDALPEVIRLLDKTDAPLAKAALTAIGPASIPGLTKLVSDLSETKKLDIAVLLVSIDPKDKLVIKTTLPVFLEAIHPDSINYEKTKVGDLLVRLGQPAVDGIFLILKDLSYRGKTNIIYRKELFKTLALLGPTCKSESNYKEMTRLRERESSEPYPDVQEAVIKAHAAMKPK
jgi:hypothetical protein